MVNAVFLVDLADARHLLSEHGAILVSRAASHLPLRLLLAPLFRLHLENDRRRGSSNLRRARSDCERDDRPRRVYARLPAHLLRRNGVGAMVGHSRLHVVPLGRHEMVEGGDLERLAVLPRRRLAHPVRPDHRRPRDVQHRRRLAQRHLLRREPEQGQLDRVRDNPAWYIPDRWHHVPGRRIRLPVPHSQSYAPRRHEHE